MKLPKKFEEYLNQGIIRKIHPNKSRANFLIKGSKNSLQGIKEIVKKIGINDKNSNTIIKDSYDIIMEIIRAQLLMKGYTSSGLYSHEAEISYMWNLGFTDNEISFVNELRFFRNGIIYYGKILDKEYATKVYEFLNKVLPKLTKINL